MKHSYGKSQMSDLVQHDHSMCHANEGETDTDDAKQELA